VCMCVAAGGRSRCRAKKGHSSRVAPLYSYALRVDTFLENVTRPRRLYCTINIFPRAHTRPRITHTQHVVVKYLIKYLPFIDTRLYTCVDDEAQRRRRSVRRCADNGNETTKDPIRNVYKYTREYVIGEGRTYPRGKKMFKKPRVFLFSRYLTNPGRRRKKRIRRRATSRRTDDIYCASAAGERARGTNSPTSSYTNISRVPHFLTTIRSTHPRSEAAAGTCRKPFTRAP